MEVDNNFVQWLSEWENPRALKSQELTDFEWGFLVSLQRRYKEFFYFNVCPAVDAYIKSENIVFCDEEEGTFSAREHMFINSMDLTSIKKDEQWEIAYANKLNYTIIHVYLNGDSISYIACTY